jgi:hypothetical protein
MSPCLLKRDVDTPLLHNLSLLPEADSVRAMSRSVGLVPSADMRGTTSVASDVWREPLHG